MLELIVLLKPVTLLAVLQNHAYYAENYAQKFTQW